MRRMPEGRTGLLLVNLGTPASPRPADVRTYLREFLSDPRVIDLPAWRRRLILELFILPFRPRRSGEAYAKIWDERGSPLLLNGLALAEKVQARVGPPVAVELAMRYGEPSIPRVLDRMVAAGVSRVVVFPLYPQYSSAATGSTVEKVCAEASRRWNTPFLSFVPPFYDEPAFIEPLVALTRAHLHVAEVERVFFSFHGLPERQMRKSDPTRAWCLVAADCCARPSAAQVHCYRAQCFATARLLADRLGVPESKRVVAFQSRLGRDPWIRPYTDQALIAEARAGRKRAAILSPAFVADCLETLEELGLRAVASWKAHGGETLTLIPCLNATDAWADGVVTLARRHSGWL